MKRLVILWVVMIIILPFFACNPQKKAIDYFNKNPNVAAEYCGDKFPVKDSIGEPVISYVPADNKDFTGEIDSLNNHIAALQDQLNQASFNTLDECLQAKEAYRNRIDGLAGQLKKLKDDYQKCKPDTVKKEVPIYRENTAKVTALQNELFKVKSERAQFQKKYVTARNIAVVSSLILIFGIIILIIKK